MSVKVKIIILSVIFCLAVGISGYGIVTGDDTIKEELPRMIILALTFAGAIVKILWGTKRVHKSLDFYEISYKKQLENAFSESPAKRKKLLKAVRFFDEDKYKKSIKLLTKLKNECTCSWDRCAVGLFLGRNYTDMGEIAKAHAVYKELIDRLEVNENIYNNMGYLSQIYYQDMEEALMYYKKALDINPKHANTYNNIANIYFNIGYWDDAEMFAKKALDLNPKVYQASSLLAIIYSCMGDEEEAGKYFTVAVSNGKNKAELKKAIEYYKDNL
ncbi:MAG: tetratricopeptide repeat protein [Clostridia bacterium]|nr:tetratricopeptide repeat protein [Clostridia bacterium]